MQISFPQRLKSDYEGYSFFIDFFKKTRELFLDDLEIDFGRTDWFDANLTAVLGALFTLIRDEMNDIHIVGLKSKIKQILSKNDFLSHFGGQPLVDVFGSTVKYRKFRNTEDRPFQAYLKDELLNRATMPRMSKLLKKKINESISEVFNNAKIHSGCSHVFTCGQYFHAQKKLDFTVADVGVTIKKNVSDFLQRAVSGKDAIKWALEEGHTTRKGNIPGGLGLSLIREFLRVNTGKMQIISADGYWQQYQGEIQTKLYGSAFPGTIVNFEFNLKDTGVYCLKNEIDINDIF